MSVLSAVAIVVGVIGGFLLGCKVLTSAVDNSEEPTRTKIIAAAHKKYGREHGRDVEAQLDAIETLRVGKDEYHVGWKKDRNGVHSIPVIIKGTVTDRYKDRPAQGQTDF